jgi:hypothetical protein
MTTEYYRNYYKAFYLRHKIRYKLYRQTKYESLKPYYRQYYINNKIKIKETSYQNKNKINKNIPTFEKMTKKIILTFD